MGVVLDYKGDGLNAERVLREGHAKYPEDRSIIHNLSYVLLMNRKVDEGRHILDKYHDLLDAYAHEDANYEAVLTATWGLVYFLEGKIEVGIQVYKQASKSAFRIGNRELAAAILQKMHIEVAKLFLSENDYASAKREIAAGLLIKRGREPYRRALNLLKISIEQRQR